jgi:spermidine synthase
MNSPYGLIPIGLFLFLLYGISLMFSRLDVLSKAAHRKIWNYALLAVFLGTAVLGLLMAVQVNYKLNVPWTEKVLKWHVNFGIGMSLVGVFHFLWHWSYYFRRRKRRAAAAGTVSLPPGGTPLSAALAAPPEKALSVLPFAIGFSGILVQTLVIRDFLTLFEGNELTTSLIAFLWLFLTGAGSLAGSTARLAGRTAPGNFGRNASVLVRTLLVVPLVLFPLMFYLRSFLFAPGIEAGPAAMAGFLAFVLLPFCFLNGFSFTWTARLLRTEGRPLRTVYGWESVGGAAGGVFCTAVVLTGLPSLTIVLLASAGLLFLIAAAQTSGGRARWIFPAAMLALAVFVQAASVDRFFLKWTYPNEKIIGTASGSSGRLTVTRTGDQVNVYDNGVLVHASGNVIVNEELTAFALVQSDRPDRVLVLGGLLAGLSDELAKYGCRQVDFVEPDPQLIRLAGKLGLTSGFPGTRLIRKTPARRIEADEARYDAVLIDLPGPQTLQLNRFYTADFFRRVKKILTAGGVAAAVLPGTANYVSASAAATLGPVVAAARESFLNAAIFPGENSYLVMADRPLNTDVPAELRRRGISNRYVNEGYFVESLFRERMEQVNQSVGTAPAANSDLKPAAFFNQIRWWLGRFPQNGLLAGGIVLAVLILGAMLAGKSLLAGMFLVGAASSGWTVTLLLLVQIVAGALYQWTGLFLGMFMIGLAAGSLFGPRIFKKGGPSVAGTPLLIFIAISGLIAALLPRLAGGGGPALPKMTVLLTADFAMAASVGACFAGLCIRLEKDTGRQDRLYGYDLLGSAVGAIGFPLVVIPLAGLQAALLTMAAAGILAWAIVGAGSRTGRILSK